MCFGFPWKVKFREKERHLWRFEEAVESSVALVWTLRVAIISSLWRMLSRHFRLYSVKFWEDTIGEFFKVQSSNPKRLIVSNRDRGYLAGMKIIRKKVYNIFTTRAFVGFHGPCHLTIFHSQFFFFLGRKKEKEKNRD